jgi:uncharacterized damage-inducible protein DinB
MADRKYPDMWLDPEDDPRNTGDGVPADEKDNLVQYLQHYRLTLELKCADLDAEQLARRSVEPSTMSLLGLVRHLGEVERTWFRRRLAGHDAPRIYRTGALADDREAEWTGAVADDDVVADAWRHWREEVAFSDQYLAAADMGTVVEIERHGPASVRDIVVHMIEEYARHVGHADLIRERIDGRTGQ